MFRKGALTKTILATLLGLFLYASDARAQSCTITFSDSFGLSLLHPSMAYGFMAPSGGLVWYYNRCGAGPDWLYLDEDPTGGFPSGNAYGHFHIPFLDPTINCVTTSATYPAGVSGRRASPGAPCVAINPIGLPRSVIPHHADGVLRISYLAHTGDPMRYLLPTSIRVIGPTPVAVLFQAADGSWWVWSGLTAGSWALTGGRPARRVFVLSSTPSAGTPWQAADLGVRLGDYYVPPPRLTCLLCASDIILAMRDSLQRATLPQLNQAAASSAELPRAELSGADVTGPGEMANSAPARSISPRDAQRMLQRPRHASSEGDAVDLNEILSSILATEGTERQVLISEYLLAASKLPRVHQGGALKQLVALFAPKQ